MRKLIRVLVNLIQQDAIGHLLTDGMRVSSPRANLSVEPVRWTPEMREPVARRAMSTRQVRLALRWGGMVRLDLSASPEHDRFQFRWIDLVDQQVRQKGKAEGGQVCTFHCPEDYPAVTQAKDWKLHVFRTKERHGS